MPIGVTFESLPKNLQAKLEPYRYIARDVESAIEAARANGQWTAADDTQYKALNGGMNWGRFDGFENTAAAKKPTAKKVVAKKPKKISAVARAYLAGKLDEATGIRAYKAK